jgi:hypothetical protein
MGKKDFSKKHGPNAIPDAKVERNLREYLKKGELPCAVAFEIGHRASVDPSVVGKTADLMGLRIVTCQLGLFGYTPEKSIVKPLSSVETTLEKAIKKNLVDRCLPCQTAWQIAKTTNVHKMHISAACNAMGIKIKPCQLGAF